MFTDQRDHSTPHARNDRAESAPRQQTPIVERGVRWLAQSPKAESLLRTYPTPDDSHDLTGDAMTEQRSAEPSTEPHPGRASSAPGKTEQTRAVASDIFDRWERDGDTAPLLAALAEDLSWTVTGSSPIAGTYPSKAAYIDGVYRRLDERLERWPVPRVKRIAADGDWAIVAWRGVDGRGRRGEDYTMDYTWWIRIHDGQIREVIGFYDGEKVAALFAD